VCSKNSRRNLNLLLGITGTKNKDGECCLPTWLMAKEREKDAKSKRINIMAFKASRGPLVSGL
jgi:hypothetical protein